MRRIPLAAFLAYAVVAGALIGVADVELQWLGPRFAALPLLLCGVAPAVIALHRDMALSRMILSAAAALVIMLATVNLVSSCILRVQCGQTVQVVVAVGFAFLYPLVTLPATVALDWLLERGSRRTARSTPPNS